MKHNTDKDSINMERVWKEFGKNTEAGKLLYNIHILSFNNQ